MEVRLQGIAAGYHYLETAPSVPFWTDESAIIDGVAYERTTKQTHWMAARKAILRSTVIRGVICLRAHETRRLKCRERNHEASDGPCVRTPSPHATGIGAAVGPHARKLTRTRAAASCHSLTCRLTYFRPQ